MIATLISMLPNILIALFFIIITWIISRLWYTSQYVHRNEVRPLQESQHIMQNQYAILAERIKNTDAQLAETKAKLEAAVLAKEEALQKIVELEITTNRNSTQQNERDKFGLQLIEEIKTVMSEKSVSPISSLDEAEISKIKEQFNFLKQTIKEFKSEFVQKFNTTTSQYHELSNQMWQLLELNKKIGMEAEALNKMIENSAASNQDDKPADRQFTLTSIKKRS